VTADSAAGTEGTLTSPSVPGNVTWCVKFLTGLTGRSYRGRNYIMGMTEDATVGNQMDAGRAAAFVANYEALLDLVDATDFTWVVLSRVQNNVPLANAIGAPIINVGYTDLNLDSQRRRLTGRGQ